MSRRNFFGALGTSVGGMAYVRFGEPEWLEINRRSVDLRTGAATGVVGRDSVAAAARSSRAYSSQREEFYLPATLVRILHLSDFHASPVVGLNFIEEAVELGLSLKPDLICLTGDFITRKYDRFDDYARILRKASSAAPTFACLGNHDGGWWSRRWGYSDWKMVGKLLRDSEVTLLHNESQRVKFGGKMLQLVGVGDMWSRELDTAKAFREVDKNLPTIALSHNPDSKIVLVGFAWNLMLCGHTHGGQLKLPIIGTPFAPVRDKRYVAGLKPWRDRWIHVTKGVGNLHGVRFNCRPEVSLLAVNI